MIVLLTTLPASANGQSTHVWISREALNHLPPGDLRDLLSRPDLEPMLIHGTMFPDGGYPQNVPYARDYAETAHWEPFQTVYLEWIRDTYDPPWSDEAEQHIAFLMGLASHGMADQTFDAFYFNWSSVYDAEHGWAAGVSFDEASDVIWCSVHGAQDVPEEWVPYDLFVGFYHDAFGIPIEREVLETGQLLLRIAIDAVGALSGIPATVADYQAEFPWGGAHLDDPALPGRPAFEAEVVAAYWEDLWARLHGEAEETPEAMVRFTWPPAGAPWGIGSAQQDVTSRVSVGFARSLDAAEVTADRFEVRDAAGAAYAVSPWLFYGTNSHVVHLIPVDGWPDDTDFTVTVRAGLPFTDGRVLSGPFTYAFSTRDEAPPAEAEAEAEGPGCGCAGGAAGGPGWARLGLPLGLAGWAAGARRRVRPNQRSRSSVG